MSDNFDWFGRDKYHHNHDYDHYHGYSHHGHGHHFIYFELARRILRNKTLLMLALIFLLISLLAAIWLVSLLVPLLGQLLSIAEQHGIKEAIKTISPYLLKLWEGAGK